MLRDGVLDENYNFNSIENTKTFDVSAVVSVYNFTSKPKFEPYMERYNFSQLLYVLEGEGIYSSEKGDFAIAPGHMFYRPAYKSSIYKWNTDSVRLALISFVCDSEAMEVFEGEPLKLYEAEATILLDVIRTGTKICEPIPETYGSKGMRFREGVPKVVLSYISSSLERFLSMVYCRILGIDLLCDETQKVNTYLESSALVDGVKAYLASHLDAQLSMTEICSEFGVSQSALSKKFYSETRRTVIEYHTALRLNEAKRRIRETGESFGAIADSMGFSSSNYFSKVFKKHTGMTPTEYSKYVSKQSIIR